MARTFRCAKSPPRVASEIIHGTFDRPNPASRAQISKTLHTHVTAKKAIERTLRLVFSLLCLKSERVSSQNHLTTRLPRCIASMMCEDRCSRPMYFYDGPNVGYVSPRPINIVYPRLYVTSDDVLKRDAKYLITVSLSYSGVVLERKKWILFDVTR